MAKPLTTISSDPRTTNRSAVAIGAAPGRRPSAGPALVFLSCVSLLLGYLDLARGGITVAPILLVLAYCVLIPAAIWQWRRTPLSGTWSPESAPRPSYLAAAIATAMIFVLYLATLAPSTAMWDTSEYMAAAYTLGLPHPPGNPLFVLIGRVFAVLPIAPTVAVRINLLAALCSAFAAGAWFCIIERVGTAWLLSRWQRIAVASLGTLIGATAFTVWTQSVVNEKVYTVSLAGIAIVSWLMIQWSESPERSGTDRILRLVAYLCGLGYANHMAGMIPMPAVIFAIMVRRPRTLLRWRLLLGCAGLVALGVTPFATQPIRAAFNPPLNEGEPTACRNGLKLSCTFSRGTYDAFVYNLNRSQYGKPDLTDRQAPFTAQIGMWWLYFKWQWVRDASGERPLTQLIVATLFLGLAMRGGWQHYQRHRQSFWYFGALVMGLTVVLIFYLNFRYGASQDPQLEVPHEVRDRDYFYLWSYSALGVWIALGLASLWQGMASLLRPSWDGSGASRRLLLVATPLLALALVPLVSNWSAASRRDDTTTVAFAHDLLNSVEPYAVLVTSGDNDTFPLWYAQEVEGIRRDVTVVVLSLMNTDWFARGILRRPTYAYDVASGPALYRSGSWPKLTSSPLKMTLAEADSLPQYVLLREPVVFRGAGLKVTIDPKNLSPDGSGGGILERADILVLRMIADSWPQRRVYISRTTGGYAQRMGLSAHVLTQGLAQAVVQSPVTAGSDVVWIEGDGWYDVARSRALWDDVFQGPAAILRKGTWVDRPSLSAPFAYFVAGTTLAQVLHQRGDTSSAASVNDTLKGIARVMRIEDLVEPVARER